MKNREASRRTERSNDITGHPMRSESSKFKLQDLPGPPLPRLGPPPPPPRPFLPFPLVGVSERGVFGSGDLLFLSSWVTSSAVLAGGEDSAGGVAGGSKHNHTHKPQWRTKERNELTLQVPVLSAPGAGSVVTAS